MEINKTNKVKGVAFQGYQNKKTADGRNAYFVNCMYDTNKYNCEFQCFRVDKNNNLVKNQDGRLEPFYKTDVPKEGALVKVSPWGLKLKDNESFKYRFTLIDKHTGEEKYLREDDCDSEGFSLVTRKGTTPIIHGPMYQAMVDTYNPGYTFAGFESDNTGGLEKPNAEQKEEIADTARNSVRTFSNTAGGTLAGLVVKLPELRESGIRRLVLTPIRGGDKSSHKYWIKNDNMLAKGIGNINDYNTLIRESFKNDINIVDDMAVTSEGLEGIHFQRAIKWMNNDNKPAEYYYFKMNGIEKGALGLGVIPKNHEHLGCKLVNFPFKVEETTDKNGHISYKEVKNEKYDSRKPSFFQIYDDRFVTDKQRTDTTKIIEAYGKRKTDNKLAVNTHDDTVFPYSFEVTDPYEILKNIQNLNEANKTRKKQIKMDSPAGTMFIGKTSGWMVENKDVGGFVCWDSNTDMPKRNYFMSDYERLALADIKDPIKRKAEEEKYLRGNCEIQDVAVSAARHLVKHVRDVQNEYVAQTLGAISSDADEAYDQIETILNAQDPKEPVLPNGVRLEKDVVANVVNGKYKLKPKTADYQEALLSSMMSLPLDSIEFADDVQGALSSPYLSKRSPDKDHIKETRYDAMKDETYKVPDEYKSTYNKMNQVFTKDIKNFADSVLKEVDKNSSEKLFEDGKLTEYGKYVVPLVGEDIAKYAITKALMPKLGTKILKNGEIAYDYKEMENGTLGYFGVNGDNQKDEATQIVNKISSGVNRLNTKDIDFVAQSINKRIEGKNANSYKIAEVMIDRGGYAVDLRFDAAKDVVDMDSIRDARQSMNNAWTDCKTFWGNIMDVVKEENPNTASFAEFTDLGSTAMVDEFLNETGVNTEANYNYFFSTFSEMFGYSFTNPNGSRYDDEGRVNRLESELNGFIKRPTEYKRNSYTFSSNHDKPRIIHCLSLDMELFQADLMNKDDIEHRKIAYMVINDKMGLNHDDEAKIHDEFYFNNVSSKAVANGWLLRCNIGKVNEEMKQAEIKKARNNNEVKQIEEKYKRIYETLSKSIADVVNGKYYKNHPEVKDEEGFVPYEPVPGHDDLKTVNEKDGFGARAIPDAFDIVFDHACHKYGLNKKTVIGDDGREKEIEANDLTGDNLLEYRNKVDSYATEVGRNKARIITRYLGALTGNPTIYAGDELGMSGYEEKCKNVFFQNRNTLDWSVVDKTSKNKRDDIIAHRNEMMGIMAQRKADDMNKMEALNDGTMYKLNKMTSRSGKGVSGIISQAGNGIINISLFNPNGISQDPNTEVRNLHPNDMKLESIYLAGPNGKMSLTPGMKFRNVLDRDKSVYRVYNDGDNYFIKKEGGYKGDDIELNGNNAPDGVMMLYHIPEDIESERLELISKKKKTRQLYTNSHHIPSDSAYKDVNKPKSKKGAKIDITSEE